MVFPKREEAGAEEGFRPQIEALEDRSLPTTTPVIEALRLVHDTGISAHDTITADASVTGNVLSHQGLTGVFVQFDHDGDNVVDGQLSIDQGTSSFVYSPSALADGPVSPRARAVGFDAATHGEVVGASEEAHFLYDSQGVTDDDTNLELNLDDQAWNDSLTALQEFRDAHAAADAALLASVQQAAAERAAADAQSALLTNLNLAVESHRLRMALDAMRTGTAPNSTASLDAQSAFRSDLALRTSEKENIPASGGIGILQVGRHSYVGKLAERKRKSRKSQSEAAKRKV